MTNLDATPTEQTLTPSAASSSEGLVILHNTLWIISIPLLALFLLTAILSKEVRRSATWYNTIGCWFALAILSLLLLGKQDGTLQSAGFGLCLMQAAALYAFRLLVATTTLAMSIQLFQSLNDALFGSKYGNYWAPCLVTFPHAISFGVLVVGIIHGLNHPELVEPQQTRMNCHLSDSLAVGISSIIAFVAMIATYAIWGRTLVLLYRYWTSLLRHDEFKTNEQILPMVKRLLAWATVSFIPLFLSFGAAVTSDSPETDAFAAFNLAQAAMGVYIAIPFGSSLDNLHQWRKWILDGLLSLIMRVFKIGSR